MVLTAETIERFGYDPRELLPKSRKPVVAQCRLCKSKRVVFFKDAHRVCKKCGTYAHVFARRKTDCAVPGAVEMPARPCRLCGEPTRKIRQLCSDCAEKVLRKEREIDSRNGARHIIIEGK